MGQLSARDGGGRGRGGGAGVLGGPGGRVAEGGGGVEGPVGGAEELAVVWVACGSSCCLHLAGPLAAESANRAASPSLGAVLGFVMVPILVAR